MKINNAISFEIWNIITNFAAKLQGTMALFPIFLECLGDEFIGLTGTLNNILGYLNLAELGIGSCISFINNIIKNKSEIIKHIKRNKARQAETGQGGKCIKT